MADLNDPTINVNLWNDDKSKSVTVTTDGPKERLDVNANIEGSVTISTTQPRWDYSVSTIPLTDGVDTSVFLIPATTIGFIDFVQIICKNSNFSVILIIDGTEELRISMSDLGSIGLLSSNSTGIPLYAASASKIFSLHPFQPFNFQSSFELQVVASSSGNNVDGYMITWREQI
jgi:hypothetical protein